MKITKDLIKKRAEHADGILPDLEELSMHQFEIEKIEVVGDVCRKLRILYLQNNIIGKMENLQHLKDLEYLNMALNNITVIEGLGTCEFLNKLDMTVNFIDVDTFAASMAHLKQHRHLRELYLMGNPCADWDGHRAYVAASLPQLQCLDGKDIAKTERILALQQLPRLEHHLYKLAEAKRAEKAAARAAKAAEAAAAAAAPPRAPGKKKKKKGGTCKHGVKNCPACTNKRADAPPSVEIEVPVKATLVFCPQQLLRQWEARCGNARTHTHTHTHRRTLLPPAHLLLLLLLLLLVLVLRAK